MNSQSRVLLALLLVFVIFGAPSFASDNISNVTTPPDRGENEAYVGNRSPLKPNPLVKLPVGNVRADGWLLHQLEQMRDGMVGHLDRFSPWLEKDNSAWVSPDGEGKNGWEELPYWLKGYGDLGYLLNDKPVIAEAEFWIEGVLANRDKDGYFGPRANKEKNDLWPNMVMLNCLQTYYEWSGDERVLDLMTGYFHWVDSIPRDKLLPPFWQKMRAGDMLQSVYWLYNRTGEEWLLDLAKKIHHRTAPWERGIANWHGVNIAQGFREPGQYYQQSWNPRHLEMANKNYLEVRNAYGEVPGGLYGADENCRPGYTGPRQAAETCSMVEFMLSSELLTSISGDALWADRCEDVAYNTLPAAITPNWSGLHYLTAPNMVQIDKENKAPALQNGGCMLAYSPDARYRCCQHNVSHGWPYFTEHLWMATRDNGLAAVLYAPSHVEARVAGGATVQIREETVYPFSETLTFHVSIDKASRFPLYLRIPGWCESASISINGEDAEATFDPRSYACIEREWNDGDRVVLTLPMEIKLRKWTENRNTVSVDRGPLTYSLRIAEAWQPFGDNPDWPNWEVYPLSDWNYALDLGPNGDTSSLSVGYIAAPFPEQPFTWDSAPVCIKATGQKIPDWVMEGGLVGEMREGPIRTAEPREDLVLIPMGCARLRVSAFPVVGYGDDAREWGSVPPQPVEASWVNGALGAVNDGREPKSSDDGSIPRFTWWKRLGSEEWIVQRLPEQRKVSQTSVYWFDDTGHGGCRVPVWWKVYWLDGKEWKEVDAKGGYPSERNHYNTAHFEPVVTDALKIVVKLQPDYSGGILEWKIR